MTNLIDIYEAMGGVVNEDRTKVNINPVQSRPFYIRLLVMPSEFESFGSNEPEKVTFSIVLDDETFLGETGFAGTPIHRRKYDEEITLPVTQVQIIKEEE